jgi:hypothetical protein
MRTSTPSSVEQFSLPIDATHVKISASGDRCSLAVIWRQLSNTAGALTPETDTNIIRITNKDGTTTDLILPTTFSAANSVIREFFLPLNYKSIELTKSATYSGDSE